MELFRQLDDKQTDKQTDGLTELFLKSLSRLKNEKNNFGISLFREGFIRKKKK